MWLIEQSGFGIKGFDDMQDTIHVVEIDGMRWHKIQADEAFEIILKDFVHYWEVYEKNVTSFGSVVQAGGYCGIFPRLLGEKFKMVYTFEPDASNFFCLSLNCPTFNVIKAQGILGNEHGLMSLVRQVYNNRGMNYATKLENSYLPTYRIDDLGLEDCSLIQLDTEGYEYNILLGAKNTIEKFKPLISLEDSNAQIEDYLFRFGYKKIADVHRDSIYKAF